MNTILWLASWYPSRIAPFDGDFIQRHAKAVALTVPVHVVHVVKDAGGNANSRLQVQDVQTGNLRETVIYYTPFHTGWKKLDELISLVTYQRVFRNYLKNDFKKNGRPALVHVHVVMRAGLMALWLQKKYALKFLVTEHWTGYNRLSQENYYERDALFRYFTRSVLKKAVMLLPVSRDLGETISRTIHPLPYTVVPNVADTALFYYSDHPVPVFRFIHVSSMNYQKNIPGLLRSFQKLLSLPETWECVMIGPADDELKAYSNKLGLHEKVFWLGELPYTAVAKELQQASAFVLFSRYETFSCVLIEAACCGLPVIAPRIGAIPEIVHQFNGRLVEPENEDELAQAMNSMIKNYKEYDRKKISEIATGLFNYERIGKKTEEIYSSMLSL